MNFYYKYVNGNKWIQISGEGNDPKNCKLTWDCSEGNKDLEIIMGEEKCKSPIYGWTEFNNPQIINNIYVQIL